MVGLESFGPAPPSCLSQGEESVKRREWGVDYFLISPSGSPPSVWVALDILNHTAPHSCPEVAHLVKCLRPLRPEGPFSPFFLFENRRPQTLHRENRVVIPPPPGGNSGVGKESKPVANPPIYKQSFVNFRSDAHRSSRGLPLIKTTAQENIRGFSPRHPITNMDNCVI